MVAKTQGDSQMLTKGIPQNNGKFCGKPMKNQIQIEEKSDLPKALPPKKYADRLHMPREDMGTDWKATSFRVCTENMQEISS